MISISTYNRYHAPTGRYYRASAGEQINSSSSQQHMRQAAPEQHTKSGLAALLPDGVDAGDLLLCALLLFLYLESHDEDFLIILLVVGFSIFNKDEEEK